MVLPLPELLRLAASGGEGGFAGVPDGGVRQPERVRQGGRRAAAAAEETMSDRQLVSNEEISRMVTEKLHEQEARWCREVEVTVTGAYTMVLRNSSADQCAEVAHRVLQDLRRQYTYPAEGSGDPPKLAHVWIEDEEVPGVFDVQVNMARSEIVISVQAEHHEDLVRMLFAHPSAWMKWTKVLTEGGGRLLPLQTSEDKRRTLGGHELVDVFLRLVGSRTDETGL
jgi:hypothetical protein